MRRDVSVAIIGIVILIAGLIFISYRNRNNQDSPMLYVTCDTFQSQADAQQYFEEHNATHLDNDRDNVACEENLITPIPTLRKGIITPKAAQTVAPTPATIKVEGKATVVVDSETTQEEPKSTQNLTPSTQPTPNPTPSPTPTPIPSPTCLIDILGLCI